MLGLIIKDIYTLRKKIVVMFASMGIIDLVCLIAAAILKHGQDKADFFFALRIEKWFKAGIMISSFAGMIIVFMMCSIVAIDKAAGWNKMLMAFPVSSWTKAASKFFALFIIGFGTGTIQLIVTFIMFKMLKFDIQPGTVKYVYAPIAIGMVFVIIRLIFEYLFNSAIAIEYSGIVAVFAILSCYVIYKFGDIDFPVSKSEIVKIFLKPIDRWLIHGIPFLMGIGIVIAATKLGKQNR